MSTTDPRIAELDKYTLKYKDRPKLPTFSGELDPHVQKNGMCHIMIRITLDRKTRRIGLRIYIKPEDWDPENKVVRKTCKFHVHYNALIRATINDLKNLDLSKTGLPEKSKRTSAGSGKVRNPDSFFDFMEQKISEFPSPASRKNQTSVLKKLRDYRQGADLYFDDITHEFLIGYRNHLEKVLGNGPNTVHHNFIKIRTAYNEAVVAGVYEYNRISPFKRVKTKKAKSRRLKLSPAKIEEIESLEFPVGSRLFHAKNAFLFSFYMQGIRASDLLHLRWESVSGDRLYYTANKTKKGRSRLVISKAQAILAHYRSDDKTSGDYIFPYLVGFKREDYNEDEWLHVVDKKNSIIRKYLVIIAGMIGLPKLSMHVARHSFADIARKKSGNVYAVCDALDHSSLKTTESYFSSSEPEENDDFVRQVLGD